MNENFDENSDEEENVGSLLKPRQKTDAEKIKEEDYLEWLRGQAEKEPKDAKDLVKFIF